MLKLKSVVSVYEQEQLLIHAKSILQPMIRYFQERFNETDGKLKDFIAVFKALRVFNCLRMSGMNPTAAEIVHSLKPLVRALLRELPVYLQLAATIDWAVDADSFDVLKCFFDRRGSLSTWYEAACITFLIQP
jgi:hypothetical protein